MNYFIYVLYSKKFKKSYVGVTNNLERRLNEHNSKKSFYTKRYVPWEIIYSEKYDNLKSARKRERYLKSAAGRKFLKEIFLQ
ncbi:MAG: GIY-YIG nuclease family protein [Candidatus Paceibacterota bacterium]